METEYDTQTVEPIYISPEQIIAEAYNVDENIISNGEEMNLGSWNNTEWAKWSDFGKFSNVK